MINASKTIVKIRRALKYKFGRDFNISPDLNNGRWGASIVCPKGVSPLDIEKAVQPYTGRTLDKNNPKINNILIIKNALYS